MCYLISPSDFPFFCKYCLLTCRRIQKDSDVTKVLTDNAESTESTEWTILETSQCLVSGQGLHFLCQEIDTEIISKITV